jgi:hypothetical protein
VSITETPVVESASAREADHETYVGARSEWWWVPGAITVLTIAAVIVVTLWQLHPSMLFTNTTTTGGDTGAHIAMPKFLETLIKHHSLTGWDPGWYDGFPLYTFYFTIPDAFIAVGGWFIPFDVAFKLGTILGSVMMPICAWGCGRFFRLRRPIPTLLAAATLPFLFDYTYTIYGGNLFSTLAGEYAYSFSLALTVLFLGLFACSVREGRYRAWSAFVLAVCVLSHIVPAFYALGGAVVLTLIELLPARWGIADSRLRLWRDDPTAEQVPRQRILWRAVSVVGTGLLLSGFWLVPFGLEHTYSTSMDYTNLHNFTSLFFPEADTWALLLAGAGFIAAVLARSRFGLTVTVLGVASAIALIADPQGTLYNVRLLPLWFISVYLMAAWAFGTGCIALAEWWRRRQARIDLEVSTTMAWAGETWWEEPTDDTADVVGEDGPVIETVAASESEQPAAVPPPQRPARRPRRYLFGPAAVTGAVAGLVAALLVVTPPFFVSASALKSVGVTVGANEVTNWSNYNYEGYEGQASYPEYRTIMQTMEAVAKRYGCGRDMWEYSDSENRFGTPEALMLLPYWTSGCIDSMEGLLFESSTTTPYHFINQAEMSAGPSEPEVGLPYGPVNVALGVQHLQLLGVKYFLAETPEVEQQADADPNLKLVARTGPWTYTYSGQSTSTTWNVYLVKDSSLVTPLKNEPVVLSGVDPSPNGWLGPANEPGPAMRWYLDPSQWNVELAQDGPASWPHTPVSHIRTVTKPVPGTKVTKIRTTDSTVSFHVSRVGSPVLVKVSYFPNWHASGADGPWRVTPNLMVVVPTSHDVVLSYGRSTSNDLGQLLTLFGVVALIALGLSPYLARRRTRPAAAVGGDVGGMSGSGGDTSGDEWPPPPTPAPQGPPLAAPEPAPNSGPATFAPPVTAPPPPEGPPGSVGPVDWSV